MSYVRHLLYSRRDTDRGPYQITVIDCGAEDAHRVEITESPTGRSVQVFVDGKKVWP